MDIFKDRVAIVTGAGSGIGRELALQLADRGAHVVVTDLFQDRIDAVVAEIKARGRKSAGYRVDHANLEEVNRFADDFFATWKKVDILCCNAGVGGGGRLEELTMDHWEWIMGVNLWGTIYMIHRFVPAMITQKSGRILITASGAGLIGLPGMAPYTASKFAMVGLAESLRGELYKHNIRVSALCPGIIRTNIVRDGRILFKDSKGQTAQSMVKKFYDTFGTRPAVVARQGLSALRWDTGIKVSPGFQMWPVYMLKRLSPTLYQAVSRFFYKHVLFRNR